MKMRIMRSALPLSVFLAMAFLLIPNAHAQQTLGGITGTVTDSSGAVISGATITLVGDQTKLNRTQTSSTTGAYLFVNLPIGTYSLAFTQQGFQSLNIPSILVQANRTATVNAELKIGNVSESITVEETPLINMVDTTNGYVLDKLEIESVPLSTSSFTGLVTLSPGVNSELQSGSGANEGLGNAPIWANGQRDTSNSFLLNGVDAKNLFNGKTTSNVSSSRVVNATGVSSSSALSTLPIQSSSSVYLAIGESIPSPPQEAVEEVRVNTSMYDAQQGSTSGAHIDMSTASGTNNIHGGLYVHRGTNWLSADPYFYNADPNNYGILTNEKNPQLHRYSAGGTIGLPVIKDKLFFFASYQYTRSSDSEIGNMKPTVPPGLDPSNCPGGVRSASCLAAVANLNQIFVGNDATANTGSAASIGTGPGQINPIAYTLFNIGCPKNCMIPWSNPNAVALNTANYSANPAVQAELSEAFPENAFEPGTAYFLAHQGIADLDWNPDSKHSFSAKYYYQHDPTVAPYAYSSIPGFTQHLDAGSQVISLSHTQIVKSNLSVSETFGFVREKAFSTIDQPFTMAQFTNDCVNLTGATQLDCTINNFGSPIFPGMTIVWPAGFNIATSYQPLLNIGAGGESQGAFTGFFQNRFNPSANAIWTHGRHTVTFGGSFAYTQMNARDRRNEMGTMSAEDTNQFLQGRLFNDYLYAITTHLSGNPNRYFRAKESGEYVQDKFQVRSNLSVTAGLRFDWMGGLTEKNGNFLNFDPSKYSYLPCADPPACTTDSITSTGLIVAGNSPHGTSGVSNSTLTGRQWGFGPRIGVAWSPKMFDSKVVVRAGWGMYYDRGELYSYLSPAVSQSITPSGPFGINQQVPFVGTQFCPTGGPGTFQPCVGSPAPCPPNNQLACPWGPSLLPAPSGNPTTIAGVDPNTGFTYLPNGTGIQNGDIPFYLGVYNRSNKLPYTMNATLDIQWQPRNDLAVDIGYVNALGRHEIIPVPFNQPRIASPANPLCGPAAVCASPATSPFAQSYTYGYTVTGLTLAAANGQPAQPMQFNSEGGNLDLRVPYIGYAGESVSYTGAGVSAYNALQVHVEKRLSHGLQAGFSYTFSRSFDEQSALGLFYNGSNPLNLRGGYAPSDFDRTHVFNIDYHYELPKFLPVTTWEGKVVDGWAIQGLVVLQSGQPYSIVDYSGAVGSIYYSLNDGITNPIVPLAPGCTPQNALTGKIGNNPNFPALKSSCFTVPLLYPCDSQLVANPQTADGSIPCSAIPSGDAYETNFIPGGGQRNIFRQAWQKRADISLVKVTQITERFSLKYTLDVFNLTNHPSFDIPIDNLSQNQFFNPTPPLATPTTNPLPSGCGTSSHVNNFYACTAGLGQVVHTIGGSRQIQMSLSLAF
jgi:hypothetical protein